MRLGTDVKAFRHSRRGHDCGGREPDGLDRRAGEELPRLERQLRADVAVRRAQELEHPAEPAGANASSGLTAQGQSTTDSSLATTFGAEVVDVLPNGMLVVQATRQLTFSQQTQLIKLRGLVRPEDVSTSEPGAVDGHDRPGAGGDRQGHRERLHLPAEPAGALPGEAAGVLTDAGQGMDAGLRHGNADGDMRLGVRRRPVSQSILVVAGAGCGMASGHDGAAPPRARAAARIKDVATIEGIRDNQLVGYGLVVGLRGTGTARKRSFPRRRWSRPCSGWALRCRRPGSNSASNMQVKNMAAVFVVATLPPFSRPGLQGGYHRLFGRAMRARSRAASC